MRPVKVVLRFLDERLRADGASGAVDMEEVPAVPEAVARYLCARQERWAAELTARRALRAAAAPSRPGHAALLRLLTAPYAGLPGHRPSWLPPGFATAYGTGAPGGSTPADHGGTSGPGTAAAGPAPDGPHARDHPGTPPNASAPPGGAPTGDEALRAAWERWAAEERLAREAAAVAGARYSWRPALRAQGEELGTVLDGAGRPLWDTGVLIAGGPGLVRNAPGPALADLAAKRRMTTLLDPARTADRPLLRLLAAA
ncbi:hypothetical protein [Streptomyces sp. NPDC002067]